jgi:hypothetical protein
MSRYVTSSLLGKSIPNTMSLNGTQTIKSSNNNYLPVEITMLKISIMNTIIIPFKAQNWKVLGDNLVFIDIIKEKIFVYTSKYPQIDLQIYSDLVDAYESSIYFNIEITNLEERLYGLNNSSANMMIKTVMLRLKPELELYNLIIGRPNPKLGEIYDPLIIDKIISLLTVENITFEQIKSTLLP